MSLMGMSLRFDVTDGIRPRQKEMAIRANVRRSAVYSDRSRSVTESWRVAGMIHPQRARRAQRQHRRKLAVPEMERNAGHRTRRLVVRVGEIAACDKRRHGQA